jgi:AraC family transcriptional regulator
MRWAGPRGLLRFPETSMLAIYHDGPDVTPIAHLRSDACVTVPVGTPVDGEVGTMTIPGGKFAVAHVEIDPTQYGEAWDRLIADWLPSSGYQPDDRLCYELYLNDPDKHPEKKHIVDICEPIRPL